MSNNSSCCACSDPLPFQGALVSHYGTQVAIATYTIIVAFGLVLTHLILITKFRWWHANPILDKIPPIVSSPISQILSHGLSLIPVISYRNDLYLIWLVVLLIAYDNVFTLSGCTLLEKSHQRISREYLFLSSCVIIGALIVSYNKTDISVYYYPLLTLWSLTLLKFIARLFSYQAAEKAYGIKNTNLVADYMKTNNVSGGGGDHCPQCMRGYKYLVIGEEKVDPDIQSPSYTLKFDRKKKKGKNIVTVDQVWKCYSSGWFCKCPKNGQTQDSTIDKDNRSTIHKDRQPTDDKDGHLIIDKDERITDVCLSFALFKLLRRRFFGFPAEESQQPKTEKFVFDGLLSRHSEKVFRILRMELEFSRDLFYTRYPLAFAFGFPVFSVVILVAMFAISLWISIKAFLEGENPSSGYSYLIVNNNNIDYLITNGLLIIIMAMEIFEVLSFIFSDWMKVIMVCRYVRRKIARNARNVFFMDKMLRLFCKPKLSKSLNDTIGQYSLLKSYNRGNWKMYSNNFLYYTTCGMLTSKMHRGMKEDNAIQLPLLVKNKILKALKVLRPSETEQSGLRKGHFAVTRNGVSKDLPWLANLPTPLHIIMVWHIATSACEMHFPKKQPKKQPIRDIVKCLFSFNLNSALCFAWKKETPDENSIEGFHLVASSLSKYCAYLVVFAPELLPTSTYFAKHIFNQIIKETSEFYESKHVPKWMVKCVCSIAEEKSDVVNDMSRVDDDRAIDIGEEKGQHAIDVDVGNGDGVNNVDGKQGSCTKNNDEKQIIEMGADLAKYLMEEIPNHVDRWKLMADMWCGLMLFLAQYGHTRGHLEKLASGGEFITHLWALLYHAGIEVNVSEEFNP